MAPTYETPFRHPSACINTLDVPQHLDKLILTCVHILSRKLSIAMPPSCLANVLVLLLFAKVALAATVTYNWDVTWVSVNPDGQRVRPAVGINGQWPCPAITANVGDRVVINVKNKLGNETTSIHFHGLYQQGSNAMDGPVGVTQCPIPPGGSFTYDFQVTRTCPMA